MRSSRRSVRPGIAKRKQTEEAVKKSEEKVSKAFRETPLAMMLTSAGDHRYIDVNETFERITGWKREEVIGRTPYDIGVWVDPDQRTSLVRKLLLGGTIRNLEVPFRIKNGEIRNALGSAELIEIDGELCVLAVALDVSDLRRAEEAKEILESRLRQFFTTLPESCCMISPGGSIVDVNPAACEVLGYSKDELIGSPLSMLYAPESHARMAELFQIAKEVGRLRDEEMVLFTKYGEKRIVLLNMGSVVDAQGEITHFTAVQVDITERRRAEESRFRHAAVVESADDAIISTKGGVISAWNMGARRMFGYTEEELIGQPIVIIVPPERRNEHREIMKRIRGGKGIEHYETVRVAKDGRKIAVSIIVSPIRDATGKVTGASKIVRDIGDVKRAEAALRESEERFRLVANTAPVMIWMAGVDKLCTYFNRPWLDFSGRPPDAELGSGWAERVHAEDLKLCFDIYTKAFDHREPYRMEYRLRRHDGEYRWILSSGVPRFDADGSFAGYIGSAIDVTERKLAEDAFSTMSQKLIEAQEEERAWLARELHDDINQRLALMVIDCDRLKQDIPGAAVKLRQELAEVSRQMEDLAKDIQALSHRLHSSKLEYLGLARAAASLCKELSDRQDVRIEFDSGDIPADLSKEISLSLFRVLQEALRNAVGHSRSQNFYVSLGGGPNQIDLTVRDTGIGFDPEEIMKGQGLGLTSMKERMKLVKGDLFIDSQPLRGTTVHARVPLTPKTKSAVGTAG